MIDTANYLLMTFAWHEVLVNGATASQSNVPLTCSQWRGCLRLQWCIREILILLQA